MVYKIVGIVLLILFIINGTGWLFNNLSPWLAIGLTFAFIAISGQLIINYIHKKRKNKNEKVY